MTVQLKKTFAIIVSTIVVENNKILMMQEAKNECYGLWYLPAGRLEKHENLVEGAQRECKEETGLEIEVVTVLCVEMQSSKWIRVSFVGRRKAGELKKIPDKESLSADWIPLEIVINGGNAQWPLRGTDIIRLVQCMVERGHSGPGLIPTIISHSSIRFQIFFVVEGSLLTDSTTSKVPLITSNYQSVDKLLTAFYQDNFLDLLFSRNFPIFILAIEFSGTPHNSHNVTDGIQFDLLIQLNSKPRLSTNFEWIPLSAANTHPNLSKLNNLPKLILLH